MEAGTVLGATEEWRRAFPGAVVGALVMRGVQNPGQSSALEERKRRLEQELRDAASVPEGGRSAVDRVLRAYVDYYRARGKSYHVKAQRESVALKGKAIPSRAALVEAMFMAELRNLILTAGHDLDALAPPLRAQVSARGDRYVALNGAETVLAPGDMLMADAEGIVSSVLRGPDQRSRITRATRNVLFAVYAPAGIGEEAVRRHLGDIRANVALVAPDAQTEALVTLG
jgi:DNA/RNA-binding domain of Phe-tRNA-synthetase-like protein